MPSDVEAAWTTVHRAGVPLAGKRAGAPPSRDALADAVHLLALDAGAAEGSGREREALGAFVLAWRDHFRGSYQAAFGPDAARLSSWAESVTPDANRRIKLRRIALETLANVI